MNVKKNKVIIFLIFIVAQYSYANDCSVPSRDEVEIIYVNGIGTNREAFESNVDLLKRGILSDYSKFSMNTSVHNATFGKPLDVLQSLSQLEQDLFRDNPDMDPAKMRVDISTLGIAMFAFNMGLNKVEGLSDEVGQYLSVSEQLMLAHGITKGVLEQRQALGGTVGSKILLEKYKRDAIATYQEEFANNLPEVHSDLMARITNKLNENKPFILLGHSQGTIIVKQAYRILDDLVASLGDEGKHLKELYGRMELASMNPWLDMDLNNSRADYTILYSDKVQSGVAAAMNFQTSGLLNIASFTDPYKRIRKADLDRNGLPDYLKFYDKINDGLGHSLGTYTQTFTELNERIYHRLDSVRSNLKVCKLKTVDASCEVLTPKSGSSGFQHFIKNAGGDAGTISFEFEAFHIPDSLKLYLNGEKVFSTNGEVSGHHSGVLALQDKSDGTDNIIDIYIDGNDDSGTSWNFSIGCPGEKNIDSRKLYDFSYGHLNADDSCELDVFVDGSRIYDGEQLKLHQFSTLLTPGEHLIESNVKNCKRTPCHLCQGWEAKIIKPGGNPVGLSLSRKNLIRVN